MGSGELPTSTQAAMRQRVEVVASASGGGRSGHSVPALQDEVLYGSEPGAASLGRLGGLEVRLASSGTEVRAAQALRYQVFYEEMSAHPDRRTAFRRLDEDRFDRICDHLLVVDDGAVPGRHGRSRHAALGPCVVGTYRLLRQSVAERHGGFYTAGEYEIGPLLDRKGGLRFLELGRSCVLRPFRNRRTVELLWHGIWRYVLSNQVDVLFGCASLEGTDPDRLALPLSYLHHHARAPDEWRVCARPGEHVEMARMPRSAVDRTAALRSLPPVIKGYLRLGAHIGDGAVVDHQFGTTDVFVILPVAEISRKYVTYYGSDASRRARRAPSGC